MVGSSQGSGRARNRETRARGAARGLGPSHAGQRGWVLAATITEGAGVGGGRKPRKSSQAAGGLHRASSESSATETAFD